MNRSVHTDRSPFVFRSISRSREMEACLILRPFSFPVAALGLAHAVKFRLALNGVAADLARIFDGELVAHALARHLEGDFAVLKFPVFDGRFLAVASRHGA